MWDILFTAGEIALGVLLGYGIAKVISRYLEKAIEWFDQAWNGIRRLKRAVGILIMKGNRLYKRFVALLNNEEIEEYEDLDDGGVEINRKELKPEILKALDEDGYIPVKNYE